jgi:hypothetical protein
MEKYMIFSDREKKWLMFLCFLPAVLLAADTVYYLIAVSPVFSDNSEPGSIMNYTLRIYDIMLVLMSIYAITGAAVLIYLLVVLARLKNMNTSRKLIWLLILCTFVPASFIAFWALVINREPYYVPVYPAID